MSFNERYNNPHNNTSIAYLSSIIQDDKLLD